MPHHQNDHDTTAPHKALFDALNDEHTGMLGLAGMIPHAQPMPHYLDQDAPILRFITAHDTDLARKIGQGAQAHFTLVTRSREVYACIKGRIAPAQDSAKLKDLWSPAAAMWFGGGIEDPKVLLLEMPLTEAAVWTVDANALQFGIEMLRANLGDRMPDLGDHAVIRLAV